jgi:hypothetical protein
MCACAANYTYISQGTPESNEGNNQIRGLNSIFFTATPVQQRDANTQQYRT